MSRSPSNTRKPRKARSSPTGQQLLPAMASLGKGLRQWMQANMPSGSGLTVPRATLLLGLTVKRGPAGMSELGGSVGMSPRSMTVLVDGLAKEGLVRRVSHPHDRRMKLVELTEAGRQVVEKELGSSLAGAAALFDDLTGEERSELLRLVEKLSNSLRARGIDVPTRD